MSGPASSPTRRASIPAEALPLLGPLRRMEEVRGAVVGGLAWIEWPSGRGDVADWLRPLRGATFYRAAGWDWFREGSRLPDFGVPIDLELVPLSRLIYPAPLDPAPATTEFTPASWRLVPSADRRPVAALSCSLAELERWAAWAPSAEFAGLQGALKGDVAFLVGAALPAVAGAERYWGDGRILVPLGSRIEPALPESSWSEAFGLGRDDRLVFGCGGAEVVPGDALGPISRATIRLAGREARGGDS